MEEVKGMEGWYEGKCRRSERESEEGKWRMWEGMEKGTGGDG